ncbi:hypothetical protein BDZ89DRAFT_1078758 [Hymenopellis radicata]|nr:hypothetical protein BDZ89DRAFT_1078758 [Hymenopellis radicata]
MVALASSPPTATSTMAATTTGTTTVAQTNTITIMAPSGMTRYSDKAVSTATSMTAMAMNATTDMPLYTICYSRSHSGPTSVTTSAHQRPRQDRTRSLSNSSLRARTRPTLALASTLWETHPSLSVYECSAGGSCTTQSRSVVLDSDWRWIHDVRRFWLDQLLHQQRVGHETLPRLRNMRVELSTVLTTHLVWYHCLGTDRQLGWH